MSTPETPPSLAPGERVGSFVIQEELGRGGMGVVYVALQAGLGRRVALKVISPRLADDPEFRERFVTEAHAQGALDSPHVVHVYDHGEDARGRLYLASQLIADGDLARVLRRDGPLSMHTALDVLAQVADGLQAAHDAELVHRDIKPANVLLRRTSEGLHAYLTDFGVVGRWGAGPATQIVGTPAYQAPELAYGAPATPATDVYALGCLLWAALTGRPPYAGADEVEVVRAHLEHPVPTLPLGSPLREELDAVVARALAKQPAARFESARDLRQALLRLLPRAPRLPLAVAVASSASRRPRAAGMRDGSGGFETLAAQAPQPSERAAQAPQPPERAPRPPERAPRPPEPVPLVEEAGHGRLETKGARRRRWLVAGVVAAAVLAVVGTSVALTRRGGQSPEPADPRAARAVAAIADSFIQGESGVYFPPGYGRCVGERTVEATGVQVLVDDDYLDADLDTAVGPADVDTMSEGVATAFADAQVVCEDWPATNRYLQGPERAFSEADATQYTDCMAAIGDEEQRTALRKLATGDADRAALAYRLDVLACTAKLI